MFKRKSNANEELFFEESVDALTKSRLDALELPLSRSTFLLVFFGFSAVALAMAGQLFFLNGWKGEFYRNRAFLNAGKEIILPAARGIIYDRFGKPMVENADTFSVSVKASALPRIADFLGQSELELASLLHNTNFEKTGSVIAARDVDPETIVKLKSWNSDDIQIVNDYRRLYLDGPAASHILGYSGPNFANEIVGKVGLEEVYDDFLKGSSGELVIYRNAVGSALDKKLISQPKNGYRLNTTIDYDLQKYFYNRLASALVSLGSPAGVGIALNPENGEVLALVSLPSFDNNLFGGAGNGKEKMRVLNSSLKPLFNRSVSGTYNPGSTIKPLVALAALKENIVDAEKEVFSAGFIEIPNPYFPDKPSRFLDWKPNGWVNLHSAIAKSSNIYFYALGGGLGDIKGLGVNKLKEYWQKFGFGRKTGIDLSLENSGYLPDPESKENRTGDIWRIGDTYNVSIGQGDLLITPIQLISQIASIANQGKLFRPFLVRSVLDDDGRILKENQPEIILDYSDWSGQLKEVRRGMEDAVARPYGTAHLLSSLPVAIAGKTGSAQTNNNTKTNAFFVGYLPAENPKIALLVLVENAREGSLNAVPVAKDVFGWYYYNRIINQ